MLVSSRVRYQQTSADYGDVLVKGYFLTEKCVFVLAGILLLLCLSTLSIESALATNPVSRGQIYAQTLSDMRQIAGPQTSDFLPSISRSASFDTTNTFVSFGVPYPQGEKHFLLSANDLRTTDYLSVFDNGTSLSPDQTQVLLFQGQSESPEEFLRLAIIRDSKTKTETIHGLSRVAGKYYSLRSSSESSLLLESEEISEEDVASLLHSCGLKLPSLNPQPDLFQGSAAKLAEGAELEKENTASASSYPTRATSYRILELATESDFENFQIYGAGTNARILNVLNQADGIFKAQLGVSIRVTFQHVQTSASQPYSSSNPDILLGQLQSYWISTFHNLVHSDAVHLFTGRELNGSTVGYSYLGAACSAEFKFGLSTSRVFETTQPLLVAHELGHIINADHDDCGPGKPLYLMCPILNGISTFSPKSLADITSFLQGNGSCVNFNAANPVNQAPVFTAIPAQVVSENSTISFPVQAIDPEGNEVQITVQPQLPGFTLAQGIATYSPDYSVVNGGRASLVQVLTFIATDSNGANSRLSVSITVNNLNRAPSLPSLSPRNISEGEVLQISLIGNDPDGDVLQYFANDLPYGAYLNRNSGTFRWKPRWNQSGNYSLTFQARDVFGAQASSTLNISVANTLSSAPPASFPEASVYRNQTGEWFTPDNINTQHGLPGDLPFLGDYDGDGVADRIVFRPSTAVWYFRSGNNGLFDGPFDAEQFGLLGDIPAVGDLDNDGLLDLVVFRQATGQFFVRFSRDQSIRSYVFGLPGDIPTVCDYDGDGRAELSLFRPWEARWYTLNPDSLALSVLGHGRFQDIPIPGPYLNANRCERAVWEADTATYNILGLGRFSVGGPGDVPSPLDLSGDRIWDLAAFSHNDGLWSWRQAIGTPSDPGAVQRFQLGTETDTAVSSAALFFALRTAGLLNPASPYAPEQVTLMDRRNSRLYSASTLGLSSRSFIARAGNYLLSADSNGDGIGETWKFDSGRWSIFQGGRLIRSFSWGRSGDIPLAIEGDGDSRDDFCVYRPEEGNWYILLSRTGRVRVQTWGRNGDTPLGNIDWDGDGISDPTIFRDGVWYILDGRSNATAQAIAFGLVGDRPLSADFDRDGRSDLAVYRHGLWYLRLSGGGQPVLSFGLSGDIPLLGNFFGENFPGLAVFRPKNSRLYFQNLDPGLIFLGQKGGAQKQTQLPTRTSPRNSRRVFLNLVQGKRLE